MNGRVSGKYDPLSQQQREVLQWVADGCPEDSWSGDAHKLAARALANRDLITTKRQQGRWFAEMLPGGLHYLANGTFDPAVVARYEQLFPGRSGPEAGRASKDNGKVPMAESPTGQHRESASSLSQGTKKARRKASANTERTSTAIATKSAADVDGDVVTSTATKQVRHHTHSAVRLLRDAKVLTHITKDHQARALALLSDLARGAEARGFTVTGRKTQVTTGYVPSYQREKALIYLDAGGWPVGIDVRQHQTRTAHVPTKAELERSARYRYTSYPAYDYTPNERLHIVLHRASPDNWEQLKKTSLEDRLPDILDAVERAAANARERGRQVEIHKQERRVQWDAARLKAEHDLIESHRADAFRKQAKNWREAERLRLFLVSMEASIATVQDADELAAACEWLSWCTAHLATLDPLEQLIAMPQPPAITPQALQPFMKGWSPYGAE